MAKINNKLHQVLMISAFFSLAACSSAPSPWTQKSSPWDNQSAQATEEGVSAEAPVVDVVEPDMNAEQDSMMQGDMVTSEGMMMSETAGDTPDMSQEPEMVPMEEPAGMLMGGDILSQPAGYFTVQVCASRSMAKLQSFARANNLSDQWTAQTSLNGKIWYILMTGVYQTKAEADESLATVRSLATRPWVRTIGSVQAVAVH